MLPLGIGDVSKSRRYINSANGKGTTNKGKCTPLYQQNHWWALLKVRYKYIGTQTHHITTVIRHFNMNSKQRHPYKAIMRRNILGDKISQLTITNRRKYNNHQKLNCLKLAFAIWKKTPWIKISKNSDEKRRQKGNSQMRS